MAAIEATLGQALTLTAELSGFAGGNGENGATFTPAVSADGTLSWTNDKGLENPEPVNIMGPAGADGAKGDKGDTGARGATGAAGSDGEPGSWHRNLLDNWYFADPINQRGQTIYTDSGYTIDRWRSNSGKIEKTLLEGDCLRLLATGSTYGWAFYQPLEVDAGMVGKTVAASLQAKNLVGTSWKFTVSFRDSSGAEIQSATVSAVSGLTATSAVIPAGTAAIYCGVYISASQYVAEGDSMDLVSAKLELGSASTLAGDPPPNKALELAKCQRYQQVIKSYSGFAKAYNSAYAYAVIPLAAPLHKAPAIGSDATATLSPWVAGRDGAAITAAAVTRYSSWNTGGSICLEFSADAGSYTEGEMYLISSADILLDANL